MQMGDAGISRQGPPVLDEAAKERGYNALLEMMLRADSFNISQADMVKASYEKIDYTFMQKLGAQVEAAEGEGKDSLVRVQELVNKEMSERMGRAAEALKKLLGAGPSGMFRLVPDYMQRGLLEESLLLLLEANIRQASEAGAKPAAELMSRLMTQIRLEIDKAVEPEIRLLRELLRIESADARRELLRQKIAPKNVPAILIAGAREAPPASKEPDVKVRKLAAALGKLKAQFGNVDEELQGGLGARIDMIAKEAEAVAREFGAGSDLTPQEIQDLMWEKGSVSVWDLEKAEDEFAQSGQEAPWEGEAQQRLKGLSKDDLLL